MYEFLQTQKNQTDSKTDLYFCDSLFLVQGYAKKQNENRGHPSEGWEGEKAMKKEYYLSLTM